jgi:hypothetical protein
MMRRVTWFVAGAASGVAGGAYAQRKIKSTAARLAPSNVVRQAGRKARTRGQDLVEAVREGRAAMRRKEQTMRDERQPEAAVATTAAQVIVLSDVRALDHLLDRPGPDLSLDAPAPRRRRGRR